MHWRVVALTLSRCCKIAACQKLIVDLAGGMNVRIATYTPYL